MPETDGAGDPFWSPDSRFIGLFAGGKLKKIDASGGPPQTICSLVNDRGRERGGSWSRDGVILFVTEPLHPEPFYQVPASGGEPRVLTTPTEEASSPPVTIVLNGFEELKRRAAATR